MAKDNSAFDSLLRGKTKWEFMTKEEQEKELKEAQEKITKYFTTTEGGDN